MTIYSFNEISGSTPITLTVDDVIEFTGTSARDFRLVQDGNDIILSNGSESLTVQGLQISDLTSDNFSFPDGSLILPGTTGDDQLIGSDADDYIDIQNGGNDVVSGGEGDDVIYAGSSFSSGDEIDGGDGNADVLIIEGETAEVEFSDTTLINVEQIRVVRDTTVSLILNATTGSLVVDGTELSEQDSLTVDGSGVTWGNLALIGGGGTDVLLGGSGNDTLSGGDGADTLSGGAGDDVLIGGLGGDILTGGDGDDRLVIRFAEPRGESSAAEENLFDHITDFQGAGVAGGDLIDLPDFYQGMPLVFAGVGDFEWSDSGDNGVQMNEDWVGDGMIDVLWQSKDGNVEIWVDTNDDGQFSEGDLFLVLDDVSSLSEDDFVENFVAWRGTEDNDKNANLEGIAMSQDNLLYAMGGDDVLSGGDGDDRIYGGEDDDDLSGDAGDDELRGDAGEDTLDGGDGDDTLIGGYGSDTLNGGNDSDTLSAGDAYYGGEDDVDSVNTLNGGAGNDSLHGAAGKDTLNGGADDDFLRGGGNDDILNGNDGADTLWGDDGDDTLDGGSGDDSLEGGTGDDTLDAGDGDDDLYGGQGQDVLTGGDGADGFRFDYYDGYHYGEDRGEYSGTSQAAPDTITDFNFAEGDKLDLRGVSNERPLLFRGELPDGFSLETGSPLTGSEDIGHDFSQVWWTRTATGIALIIDSNDDFELSGADFVIHLDGLTELSASDFVEGTFTVLTGTLGDDTNETLSGLPTSDGDIIFGLTGDDVLSGGDGDDRIYGGEDDDDLSGDAGDDELRGDAGEDTLDGGDGDDTLIGGYGSDTLNGGNDSDTLSAGDAYYGGEDDVDSVNTLNGGAGNDSLHGAAGKDTLNGGADDDFLRGGGNDDILNGNDGADTLWGDDGDDTLDGGSGDDSLEGGTGDDTLDAGDGDDDLYGGQGQDVLTGGDGADGFRFDYYDGYHYGEDRGEYSGTSQAAPDTITDFNFAEGDKLDLRGVSNERPLLFRGELPDGFSLETGSPLTGSEDIGHDFSQVWWTRTATGIALIIDSNDDFELSGADFVIHLDGLTELSASDFVEGTFTVLTGTLGDDTNETLSGLPTSDGDIIFGLTGDDVLSGGDGDDRIYGGEDDDDLSGDAGDDELRGDAGEDTLDGGDGDDTLIGGYGSDTLNGGNDSDTLSAGDAYYGGEDDVDSVNTLNGGAGNDSLHGAAGKDTLNGGADDDFLRGGGNDDILNGNDGADTLWGDDGDDTLDGGSGDDSLEGGTGDDTLDAGDGDDDLYGGQGQDVLTGGDGADGFRFDYYDGYHYGEDRGEYSGTSQAAPDTITDFNFAEGDKLDLRGVSNERPLLFRGELPDGFSLETGSPLTGSEDIGHDFSQVWWTRTATGIALIIDSNDDFELSGADFVIHLDGLTELSASDFVEGTFTVLTGTLGDDTNETLSGLPTSDGDIIFGLTGDDVLSGGDGDDRIYGGEDDDDLSGDAGDDELRGDAGEDTLDGGDGDDTLIGGYGSDTLNGGNDSDTLSAGDAYYGGEDDVDSVNTLNGGAGNDSLHGAAGKDTLNGGADDDFLRGGGNDDILNGNDGADTLWGDDGDDTLDGGSGDDSLEGGTGDDTLDAGDGDDDLYGGQGQDVLTGGDGADGFRFDYYDGYHYGEDRGEYSGTSQAAPDTITDFNFAEGDKLDLRGVSNERPLLFRGELPDGFSLETGSPLTGSEDIGHDFSQVWWTRTATGIALIIDSNDDFELSGADFVIHLDGLTELSASDFVEGTFTVLTGTLGDDTNETLSGLPTSDGDIIFGLTGDDVLSGGDGDDRIYGGEDDDDLSGDAGDDELRGDAGEDTLDGGDGDDTLIGGYGSDTLNGGNDSDTLSAGDAYYGGEDDVDSVNTLNGGAGNDSLHGAAGKDTLNGGADDDFLRGGGNDDILNGNDGADTLWGDDGDDTLDGGSLADTMAGGTGDDTYIVNVSGDVVTENEDEGSDTVRTAIGYTLGDHLENLVLTGSDGINGTGNSLANVLTGNSAANVLSGEAGNDRLDGGAGADTLIGGIGDDTYVMDSLSDTLTEAANAGTDTVETHLTYTLKTDFENLLLTGSGNVNGTGNAASNEITGNSGANTLDGGAGADTLDGGDGADKLTGGLGDDTLTGGAGDDLAVYTGNRSSYVVTLRSDGKYAVADQRSGSDNQGIDILSGIEKLQFSDGIFAIGDVVQNLTPHTIALSKSTVTENVPISTTIGTFSAVDPEGKTLSYTLTDDADGLFKLSGSKLQLAKAIDYETTKTETVTIEISDGVNKVPQTFTISVSDVNEAPTSVALSNAAIAEDGNAGATIGTFWATDPEGKALTYKLTDTAGGLFKLDGSTLQLAKTVDYETLKSDTVTIEVKDAGGLTTTKTFTISVTDVNEAPVSIGLSKATIAENSKVGTTIGTFSATDPEGKPLTYKLTDTAGGLFKLDGSTLQLAKTVDYETLKSDTVTIEVKDAGGLTTTKTFTISIADANEAPVSIGLSKATIAENSKVGTTIGTFSATDPEGKPLTYKLTDTAGGLFKLDGSTLQLAKTVDYETLKSDTVTIEVKDAGGLTTTKTFTISIADANEAPVSIGLSKATIAENSKVGTTIGTFSATDPEGKPLTYKLTDTAGGLFKLDGSTLQLAKTVDYETLKSDTVTIEVKDAGGLTTTKTFTISIADANEAPVSIGLSKATIAENSKVGTTIGTFSATDPEGKPLTYKLTDTAGGLFKLDGSTLQLAKTVDYETLKSDTVTIEVKDAGGLTTTKTFTIKVTDVMETITGTSASQTLKGGIGADEIVAGAGNDVLKGEGGNDKLYGGLGADDLHGGTGKDVFQFKASSDSKVASSGRDTIFDFSGAEGDRIDLSSIDAKSKTAANDTFSFIGTKEFSGKAGELRYDEKKSDTYVYGDTDGDGKADFAIHLDDAISFQKGYFTL